MKFENRFKKNMIDSNMGIVCLFVLLSCNCEDFYQFVSYKYLLEGMLGIGGE